MTPETAVLIFSGLGGLAGVGAVINALWQRRKIYAEAGKSGADSAQILSATAVALLEPMQLQVARLSANLTESQTRADSLDRKLRKTNYDLDIANENVKQLRKRVDDLTTQITRYQDHFGPLAAE